MRPFQHLSLLLLFCLLLSGCTSYRYAYMKGDLTREGWIHDINPNTMAWTRGADNWFFTGDPNPTEIRDRYAPYSAAISTMSVRVPNFTNIKVNGDFQVQLVSAYGPNSLYIYGPNVAVRDVVVEVRGNTLCLSQVKRARQFFMRRVIIRIAVNTLYTLTQNGCGSIEGVNLCSPALNIVSTGRGRIYLSGKLNLRRILNLNGGPITVLGTNAAWLDIKTYGMGSVNVSGNIGLRSIIHHGRNNIYVLGAYSPELKVYADGIGKVEVSGRDINLTQVTARNATRVYAYNINSHGLYAYGYDKAIIGLAGMTDNLFVDTHKGSLFWGRYLCACNAFVRAHDWSHINVAASNKIFAAATENGSVYFFGAPELMSQFVEGNGAVIPIWTPGSASCASMATPFSYKGENLTTDGFNAGNYSYVNYHKPPRVIAAPVSAPRMRSYSSSYNTSGTSEVPFTATRSKAKTKALSGQG